MSVAIRQLMIAPNRYNVKSPYSMAPKGIVFHNTAGRASAMQEAVAKNGNNKQSSIHIFVDEKEAIQCLPFNRNSWHAHDGGSGYANRNLISLEVCRSMSDLETFKKAEDNAFQICAQILKGLGLSANSTTIRWHKEFASTACPHRSAELGNRNRVIAGIQKYMESANAQPSTQDKNGEDTMYRIYTIVSKKDNKQAAMEEYQRLAKGTNREFVLIPPQKAAGGDDGWRIGQSVMATENLAKVLENIGPDQILA